MAFSIITDAAANLTEKLIRDYDIGVIPFPYFVEGKEYGSSGIENFNSAAYYDSIRRGAVVTTAQINPQKYMERMEPLLEQGKDILFVGLSSGISGSFASACMAREELLEKYPKANIELIDSLGASLGEGLLALRAAKCRENGMSLEETTQRILKMRKRMYQVFIVDDLMHLRRTGRLSNVSAIVGSVLGIKPLLKGNEEGKIVAFGKIRGRKQAIRTMAEKFVTLAQNTSAQTIGISHCDCEEDARYLVELIKNNLPPKEFLLVAHEPATGSHIGPGSLALYFEGDETVRSK